MRIIKPQDYIDKSHEWVEVQADGRFMAAKVFEPSSNTLSRMLLAIWNGSKLYHVDGDTELRIYDPVTDTYVSVTLSGTARSDMRPYGTDIIVQDYNGMLYRIDENGNIIWQTDLKALTGACGGYNKIIIQDGYIWATGHNGNNRYVYKVNPDTGEVLAWNYADISYAAYVMPYIVGDLLILSSDKAPYCAVFNKDLTLLSTDPRDYPDAIPWTMMGRIIAIKDYVVYYTDEWPRFIATDEHTYGEVYRALIDGSKNALWVEYEVPLLQPANRQDAFWGASNQFDDIMAMRGYDASGNYVTLWNEWRINHWSNPRWGYLPLNEPIYVVYAVTVSNWIEAIKISGWQQKVINIYKKSVETFKYYSIFVSKDAQTWVEVQADGMLAEPIKDEFFIKVEYNPYCFTLPYMGDIILIELPNVVGGYNKVRMQHNWRVKI